MTMYCMCIKKVTNHLGMIQKQSVNFVTNPITKNDYVCNSNENQNVQVPNIDQTRINIPNTYIKNDH